MDMNGLLSWALNGVLTIAVGVFWSIIQDLKTDIKETKKELYDKTDKIENEFSKYQIHVAASYLTREEMKHALEAITATLERHSDKLDSRIDKLEGLILEARRQ